MLRSNLVPYDLVSYDLLMDLISNDIMVTYAKKMSR